MAEAGWNETDATMQLSCCCWWKKNLKEILLGAQRKFVSTDGFFVHKKIENVLVSDYFNFSTYTQAFLI